MIDFKKRLVKSKKKIIHPCEIYETLDRASDIGPLRPVQETILNNWYDNYRQKRDVIIKLHTGQGKTLIGLLILQSRINEDTGPSIYLCPDNYLVQQTCDQAERFGIKYLTIIDDLPDDFEDGKVILIANVNELFNGMSKFGLGARFTKVSTVLMDDAHACINYIKNAYTITLKSDQQAYDEILTLFGPELEKQGVGTYTDICNKEYAAFLPVPYWDWQDKHIEIAKILSNSKRQKEIRFAWPILKDMLKDCRCIISGDRLEISPYISPLDMFGSYSKAEHRIFMSATVNDDSFFMKGLGINAETVKNPLLIKNEKWSGEKMILIPTLIDESLNRSEIVNLFSKSKKGRKFGIVALVPSFKRCQDWEGYGSTIANKGTIIDEIEKLKNRDCEKTLVIVNRYDGIDLPDHACRIMIFDSKSYGESLEDLYFDQCRSNSEVLAVKMAQVIEQGLGRGVRGEKDYCAILLTGNDLVKIIRSRETRKYFSLQTRTQVEIGIEIAEYAKEEIKNGTLPQEALKSLINQLLKRDEGWKNYYTESMDSMTNRDNRKKVLDVFEAEQEADNKYREGNYSDAVSVIQRLIDSQIKSPEEKGWYLQEMARYIYPSSVSESNKFQVAAHKNNMYLFKPKAGMKVNKISGLSLKRIESIISWIQAFENYQELKINIDEFLSHLRFGVEAERFEKSLDDIAKALGFISQRPCKEWNEGPDNLWKVNNNQYLLIECKSKVLLSRKEINKDETGQMNNACAWFAKNYGDVSVKRIMIIPTKKISHAAGFNLEVQIMREKSLKLLTANVSKFFNEFKDLDLKDLSERKINELLVTHKLTVDNLLSSYSEAAKQ